MTSLDIAAPIALQPAQKPGWSTILSASLRQNLPLLLVIGFFVAAVNLTGNLIGLPYTSFDSLLGSYLGYIVICAATFTIAFIARISYLVVRHNLKLSNGEALKRLWSEFFNRERILIALPMLAVWPLLATAFSLSKTMIPALNPFYLDPILHAGDRLIHFGQDPWALLQPILGYPIVTAIIDKLYALWLLVIYLSVVLHITSTSDPVRRMQFLMSNMLAWILVGGLLAVLLSSVGPCFYQAFYGSDVYLPLTQYLRETVPAAHVSVLGYDGLFAIGIQDTLLQDFQTNATGFGRGISAAPSMHVASTWMMARVAQTYGKRWLSILAWSFFGCILIGSVHLGWHYALDGYISIAVSWAIWRSVGWIIARPRMKAMLFPNA